MNLKKTLVLLVSIGILSCSSGPGPISDSVRVDEEKVVTATEPHNSRAPERVDPIDELAKKADLHTSLTDLHHFADRVVGGVTEIDMGRMSARGTINGGWRTGWNPTSRADANSSADYFEANKKAVRVFFQHDRGGFDRIVVRMRAVKNSNKVSFHLNGNPLTRNRITKEWSDVELEIPKDFTRDGENQLLMRFSWDTRVDGRVQVAHVDRISVLSPGASLVHHPALRGTSVTFGGVERQALVAHAPQTIVHRLHLPGGSPQLALSSASAQAGAEINLSVRADGSEPKSLLVEGFGPPTEGWKRRVLDLSEFAGRVVELRFEIAGAWDEGQQVAWDAAVYSPVVSPSEAKPASNVGAKNVLVFLVDTLRYDKLGVNNPKTSVPTPNFDSFAADATIFDAAYDTENWTKPSTASILTGLYPDTHRTKDGSSKLPASVTMISQHMQKQDFRTAAFIANGYVSKAFGFKKGWHRYINYIREEKVTDAERVVADSLKWIEKQGDQRWFAYVHTIDPHVPYSAPGAWKFARWSEGKYRGPLRAQSTGNQIAEIKSKRMKVTPTDKAYLEALYDGEVAYNDHYFGKMVEGLRSQGVYENTLIVVLADHGEEFWDHGSVGHGHSIYNELVHTPLFVRCPGSVSRGTRYSEVLSTAGLVPTITDVLGVDSLPGVEGASWAPFLEGNAMSRPRIGVSDFLYRKKSIRVGPYHWLTNGRDGKLFDVLIDPREKKNLAASHPIAWAFARKSFGLFYGASDKPQWWLDETGDSREKLDSEEADIDSELQKQLEAMGYVDGAINEHSAQEDRKLMDKEDK